MTPLTRSCNVSKGGTTSYTTLDQLWDRHRLYYPDDQSKRRLDYESSDNMPALTKMINETNLRGSLAFERNL